MERVWGKKIGAMRAQVIENLQTAQWTKAPAQPLKHYTRRDMKIIMIFQTQIIWPGLRNTMVPPTPEEETPTHSIQPNQEAQLQSTFAYAPHSLPDPAISPIPPPRKRKARWQHKQFVNINEAFKRDGLSRSKYIHCA